MPKWAIRNWRASDQCGHGPAIGTPSAAVVLLMAVRRNSRSRRAPIQRTLVGAQYGPKSDAKWTLARNQRDSREPILSPPLKRLPLHMDTGHASLDQLTQLAEGFYGAL